MPHIELEITTQPEAGMTMTRMRVQLEVAQLELLNTPETASDA